MKKLALISLAIFTSFLFIAITLTNLRFIDNNKDLICQTHCIKSIPQLKLDPIMSKLNLSSLLTSALIIYLLPLTLLLLKKPNYQLSNLSPPNVLNISQRYRF